MLNQEPSTNHTSGILYSNILMRAPSFIWNKLNTIKEQMTEYAEPLAKTLRKKIKNITSDIFAEILYKMAGEKNIVGVSIPESVGRAIFQNPPKKIYYVTGSRSNLIELADSAEKHSASEEVSVDSYDLAAREPLSFFISLIGRDTLPNKMGPEARRDRVDFKNHMNSNIFGEIVAIGRELSQDTFNHWDASNSFQNQIMYITSNILGKSFLGFPSFDLIDIPQYRITSDYIADTAKNEQKLEQARNILNAFNDKLSSQAKEYILNKQKFIFSQLKLNGNETKDEISEKIRLNKPVAGFLADGNVSMIVMAGLMQVHNNPQIKQQLLDEINLFLNETGKTSDTLSFEDIKKMRYLECIYKETLRVYSPAPAIARGTSRPLTLNLQDTHGKKHEHTVPANSYVLFPIRREHHNASVWKHPKEFNPSRFDERVTDTKEIELNAKYFMPFSVGKRSCPAQFGLVDYTFKIVLIESLNYKLTFNKKIERFSANSLESRFKEDYYAQVQPDKNMRDTPMRNNSFTM